MIDRWNASGPRSEISPPGALDRCPMLVGRPPVTFSRIASFDYKILD